MTIAIDNRYYNNNDIEELTSEELAFFRNELEAKKIKVEKTLANIEKELKNFSDNEPRDEADHALLAAENLTNNKIFTEQQKTLNLIKRSLNKMTFGTYGVCTSCEEPINKERLKVKLFTEYCVPCMEEIERARR